MLSCFLSFILFSFFIFFVVVAVLGGVVVVYLLSVIYFGLALPYLFFLKRREYHQNNCSVSHFLKQHYICIYLCRLFFGLIQSLETRLGQLTVILNEMPFIQQWANRRCIHKQYFFHYLTSIVFILSMKLKLETRYERIRCWKMSWKALCFTLYIVKNVGHLWSWF